MAGGPSDPAAARLAAQQLTDRSGRSPTEVVRNLLAVQAQDQRGARLAIRSRSVGVASTDVDQSLNNREMVVSWLNRGTLHLVCAEDYWWLHPLTTPQLRTANARRLRQEGVTAPNLQRATDVIVAAVAEGPMTRSDIRALLDGAGIPTAGQALVHILVAATIEGLVVRGPMVGKEQAFVSVDGWLGSPPPPMERAQALARLGNRYLASHAPASDEDLANWAGITLGEARQGLEAAGPIDRRAGKGLPTPRLLGPFDPLLHGWKARSFVLGEYRSVITTNGVFRAVALVGGRVVGTWGLRNGIITIVPLEPVADGAVRLLTQDAQDVLRFLGLPERPATVTGIS
jgi:DNA glycosylase AlkZ-like